MKSLLKNTPQDRSFLALRFSLTLCLGVLLQTSLQDSTAFAAEAGSPGASITQTPRPSAADLALRLSKKHVYEIVASESSSGLQSDLQSNFSGEALARRLSATAERITNAWNTLQAKSRRQMADDYVIDIKVSKDVSDNACRFEITIDGAGRPHLQALFGATAILQPEFVAEVFAVLYAPYAHQANSDVDRLYPYEWLGLFHDARFGDRAALLELKKLWVEGLNAFPIDWLDIYFSASDRDGNQASDPSAKKAKIQATLQSKAQSLAVEVSKDTQALSSWRETQLRLHQEKLKKSKWNISAAKLRDYLGDLFSQNKREEFAQFLMVHLPWRLMSPTQRQIWENQIRAIKEGPTASDVIVYRSASTTKFYLQGKGQGYASMARVFEEGLRKDLSLESIFTPVFSPQDRNQATSFWLTNIYEAERAHSAGGTSQSPFISTATMVEPSLEFLNTPGTARTGQENVTAWRVNPAGTMPSLMTTWQEEEILRPFGFFADEFVAKVDVPGDINTQKISTQIKTLVAQYQNTKKMAAREQSVTTDSELGREFIFRLWTDRNSNWTNWTQNQDDLKKSSLAKLSAELGALPLNPSTNPSPDDQKMNLSLREQIISLLLDTKVDKNFEAEWTGTLYQLSLKNPEVRRLVSQAFDEIQKVGKDPRQNQNEIRFLILRLLIDQPSALRAIQFDSLAGVFALVDESNRVLIKDHARPLLLNQQTQEAFIAAYRQLIETRLSKSQDPNEQSLYNQAKMFLPKTAEQNPQCKNIVP